MLVWLASYPRSGNTFLRILLYRLYGVRSSVVYDVDGVAQRLGPQTVGFEPRSGSFDVLRASDQLHVVKTHRQRDSDVDPADPAICLVRDGRDAVVSWARLRGAETGQEFRTAVEQMIHQDAPRGTGRWGTNVLSWLQPPAPRRAVLRYEDLVEDPSAQLHRVLTQLTVPVAPMPGATVPTFDELQQHDRAFFRRGHPGTHRDELPDDLHQLFWSYPDNAAAMRLLGYDN